MNMRRILIGTVVGGVVGSVIDFILNGYVLAGMMAAITIMNPTPNIPMLIAADFVAALMLMVAWDRFGPAAGAGVGAGAKFGAFIGLLITFPAQIFNYLLLRDYPYSLAWMGIGVTVVWYAIVAAAVAAVDKPART